MHGIIRTLPDEYQAMLFLTILQNLGGYHLQAPSSIKYYQPDKGTEYCLVGLQPRPGADLSVEERTFLDADHTTPDGWKIWHLNAKSSEVFSGTPKVSEFLDYLIKDVIKLDALQEIPVGKSIDPGRHGITVTALEGGVNNYDSLYQVDLRYTHNFRKNNNAPASIDYVFKFYMTRSGT